MPPLSDAGRRWPQRHVPVLDDAAPRRGLRLMWSATGDEDFLLPTTLGTVALFERHGFSPEFVRTNGGHTWLNWPECLARFAPRLLRASPPAVLF